MLVFLHEGLGSIDLWKRFPDELAERTQCGVLVYSRYGNGYSDVLQEPRTVEYMHDEARAVLPAVLDAFDVKDAVLFGQSDGASIALIHAGEGDGRVRALVAEAPHVFVEDLSVASIAQAKTTFETTDMRERLARYHADAAKTFYGWNDIWLDPAFRSWNIEDAVRKIRVPMLVAQGAADEYGTVAQIAAIRADARFSRVDALELDDCGHAPHRDRPELVLGTAAAFIASVP